MCTRDPDLSLMKNRRSLKSRIERTTQLFNVALVSLNFMDSQMRRPSRQVRGTTMTEKGLTQMNLTMLSLSVSKNKKPKRKSQTTLFLP
jgi:hypothetical protein